MRVVYSSTAAKKILRLPPPERKKILRRIYQLSLDPCSGKKLKGKLEGLWSFRAWPYRIIYQIESKELHIVAVDHRQGVYK